MINDLDRTIQNLLELHLPRVRAGEVEVAFHQPNSDWRREKAALNFFLYDLRQNPTLRQHQWQETQRPEQARAARLQQRVLLQRPPLRLDCFYMVSAWINDYPVDEHRLLSECLMVLARYPVLNRHERAAAERAANGNGRDGVNGTVVQSENGTHQANGHTATDVDAPDVNFLAGSLRDLTTEIPTRLAEHDVLTNPAEVWGSLENGMKAAFSYVVTLPLNPWQPILVPEVTTVMTEYRQIVGGGQSGDPQRGTEAR